MPALKETEHARQRRAERGIDKKDLKAAMKHGQAVEYRYGWKYKYNGLTYIVSWDKRKEITCYADSVKLKKVKVSAENMAQISLAKQQLAVDHSSWKSNTVIIVDTSGSMKKSDVWGARSRLDSVWICIALDFIAHRIESGDAGLYDVISIVFMGENGHSFIKTQPTSWDVYNKIVDTYNRRQTIGKGHGYYVPSLKLAEKILTSDSSSSCALSLCFMSDGRPSDMGEDRQKILPSIESLGTRFGRRLSFAAIGIGNDPFEFEMLKKMVDSASDFGVQSSFVLPSMTTSSLGLSLTSLATTLAKTQTEMTDLHTLKQRPVRQVLRESRKKANEETVLFVSPDDYWIYPVEKVTRRVYREWQDKDRKRRHSYEVAPMQHPSTHFVALHKKAFGEGAERYAFRFFEVGEDGTTVVSKPLVAKESRLVLDGGEENRVKFVRSFLHAQQLARRIAEEFNEKLDQLYRVDDSTPRVTFLDCSVYELDDINLGKQEVLVEEKIDHLAWHKWNMNNGYIEGMEEAPAFTHEKMKAALDHLTKFEVEEQEKFHAEASHELDAIVEDDEDEDSSASVSTTEEEKPLAIKFSASEVAQAFSHFSYMATGRKRLICDLQGVFDEKSNTLMFTDPVIHYFNYRKQERKNVHGRTDQGRKGMAMFFDTHKECCGRLCRLVTGGFRKARHKLDPNSRSVQS